MGFFDPYHRFYGTSQTGATPGRLNARYEAIVAAPKLELAGRRVLDLASHDGRWAFAALKSGAAHVLGIEARQDLVDHARANFEHYRVDSSSYRFLCADAFEGLRSAGPFDVVICAGFYYHTARHVELFDLMERTRARLIVIDTAVAASIPVEEAQLPKTRAPFTPPLNRPYFVQLSIDRVELESDAFVDSIARNGATIVGRPSAEALTFVADHFGFSTRRFDWHALLAAQPEAAGDLIDYARGWRQTFYCQR